MSAWNMNTSRGRPGGQGSLFSVADKDSVLNPAVRWPKGYSPERRDEVSAALADTRVRDTTRAYPPQRAEHVRARLVDAISRSTVPTEHLAGLREVHDQPAPGQRATYWPARQEMAVHMFEPVEDPENLPKRATPAADADRNLIHELGHHHDQANKVTAGLTKYDPANEELRKKIVYAPSGKGTHEAAEAVADNYYVEHYRGPGRKAERATQGRYEDTGLADRMQGYRAVRPAPQLGPQWSNLGIEQVDRHLAKQGLL